MLQLPQHLLWEYDIDTFDYDRGWRLVIERVIQRGDIAQWRATQHYYGKEKFLEVAKTGRQLTERDKTFTSLYVNSTFNDVHRQRDYQAGNLPTAEEAARRLQTG